jgi:hypothetical protein
MRLPGALLDWWSMIRKSVKRFSEKIMLKQRTLLFGRADGGKSAPADQAG